MSIRFRRGTRKGSTKLTEAPPSCGVFGKRPYALTLYCGRVGVPKLGPGKDASMPGQLITRRLMGSVAEVLHRLEAALHERDIEIFATVDHAKAARDAGLDLSDEVVVIFGNPSVGTKLMQRSPEVGLDLPLRMLIWDEGGVTHAAYRAPSQLAQQFDLSGAEPVLVKLDEVMATLLDAVDRA